MIGAFPASPRPRSFRRAVWQDRDRVFNKPNAASGHYSSSIDGAGRLGSGHGSSRAALLREMATDARSQPVAELLHTRRGGVQTATHLAAQFVDLLLVDHQWRRKDHGVDDRAHRQAILEAMLAA